MADVVIYHNPRCSNSRTALALLSARGETVEVVEYLKAPPDRQALEALVAALEDDPAELVRHDNRFAELGLDPAGYTEAAAVVDLLLAHPELMQRPVLVSADRAIIGRPPAEKVPAFLD
ncbi:MAG TPA: ArsC/Spx/MgsR family protein [Acidimicrobiales bacterium]